MKTDHTSLIRGLNIAVIVLAALSLIASIVAFSAIEGNKSLIYDYALSEYGYTQDYYDYFDDDFYYDFDDDYWDGYSHNGPHHSSASYAASAQMVPVSSSSLYTDEDVITYSIDIMLAIINGVLIWEMVISAAALVFGIFGVVSAGKREKLKAVMVMGIIGAVLSFFGGHIILMVLFIISAVMANKDKNMPGEMPSAPMQTVPYDPAFASTVPSQTPSTDPAIPSSPQQPQSSDIATPVTSAAPAVTPDMPNYIAHYAETTVTETPVASSVSADDQMRSAATPDKASEEKPEDQTPTA